MPENQKQFKRPPKKYHPQGLSILYEDRDILVVDKMCGLLTVSSEKVKENTAHFLLNEYVRKGNPKSKNRIFIVHRLDRDTSGVILFAKSVPVKLFLQEQWNEFRKTYFAVVQGRLKQPQGVITSYLAENRALRVYSVNDPAQGKQATTLYSVLQESTRYSLLEIELVTGRKNQIRVHLADQGHPVVGDKKYGRKEPGIKRLALHAASITLIHPFTKEQLTIETRIPDYFRSLMDR